MERSLIDLTVIRPTPPLASDYSPNEMCNGRESRDLAGAICETDVRIQRALSHLYRAYQLAVSCQRPAWDFAVDLSSLRSDGVAPNDLRWLVGQELAEHVEEIPSEGEARRTFAPGAGFRFSSLSCFAITSRGVELARQLTLVSDEALAGDGPAATRSLGLPAAATFGAQEPVVPQWDHNRHELRVGPLLVKRYKGRAENQFRILAAFEEEGWPSHIDDPLPPAREINPKRRLSDTIRCLNRKHDHPVIRFGGDGTGTGVLWDFTIEPTGLALFDGRGSLVGAS
jgi:hypothetical protein